MLAVSSVWSQETTTIRGVVRADDPVSVRDLSRGVVFLEAHPNLAHDQSSRDRPHITQKNRAFIPDLLVIPRGTTVEFPNGDPFHHNVFSKSRAAQFDLDRYPQGQSKSYTFEQVGLVQLFCNIHPEMRAVIVVVPNRYFTRCDAEGRFELPGVPPGRYTLAAWHEHTGRQQLPIEAGVSSAPIMMTLPRAAARRTVDTRPRGSHEGVQQGLGIKRERLNLPVVQGTHPAETGSP
jgi:plastocyanin